MEIIEVILSTLFPPRLPKWSQPVEVRKHGADIFESEIDSAIGRPQTKLYIDAIDRRAWQLTYEDIT